LNNSPIAAAVTPLPTDETTPPVKNKYFVVISTFLKMIRPERSDECPSRSAVEGQFDVSVYYLELLSFDCAQDVVDTKRMGRAF
jgi:hypothetical protein